MWTHSKDGTHDGLNKCHKRKEIEGRSVGDGGKIERELSEVYQGCV
jgi:hypothetical protein